MEAKLSVEKERTFHIGDRVLLEGSDKATVVVSTITDEYSERYPKSDWGHTEPGVMFETDAGALVFFALENLLLADERSLKRI